jgi:hypothetical protein
MLFEVRFAGREEQPATAKVAMCFPMVGKIFDSCTGLQANLLELAGPDSRGVASTEFGRDKDQCFEPEIPGSHEYERSEHTYVLNEVHEEDRGRT